MDSESRISCREITKYYPSPRSLKSFLGLSRNRRREKPVLDAVSFEIGRGEIFGIVGPNGAGKTTIMKILSHLTSPTSGRARVCGYDIEREWNDALRCIGYCISEERSFFWRLSGRENLRFFADLLEVPAKTARSRIEELLEMLELSEVAGERFMSYSSGMKQKMAVARSLLADPVILLMDEPTRGLDPRAGSDLRAFITAYVSRQDRTAVITTNQVIDIEKLCRRIAVLNRGRIIAQGTIPAIGASLGTRFDGNEKPSFESIFNELLARDDASMRAKGGG